MASRVLKTGTNQITTPYSTAHKAVDIVKYKSSLDAITAHTAGTVVFCQTGHKNNKTATGNASYGNCVKLDHGNGYTTLYAHLSTVAVKLGDKVTQGQVLGAMGNTGRSFGAHLHFEVRKNNNRIDPTPFLEADLPIAVEDTIHVFYRAYAGKWWAEIKDCNDLNNKGYAGVQAKSMTSLMVKAAKGAVRYRVHLLKSNRWLNWIEGYNTADKYKGYAGNKGQEIDAVQIELCNVPGYVIKYRVSPKNSKTWYDWCTNTTNATGAGYAGVLGTPIDCIQIKIERG